jgi:amidohydrolase
MNIKEKAFEIKEKTIAIRRDIHRHPELGFEEFRTSKLVSEKLIALGLDVQTEVAETGVVGLLKGTSDSPVLLLRFDMDALPIQEETTVPYASEKPGKMHACGHDSHVSVGLSVAEILSEMRESLRGTIKFVFQPAEEGGGGAEKMVEAGVLENPKPDFSMGIHVWNDKPVGWYGVTQGPIMAGAQIFEIKITGKGGHAAAPHLSIDPIVASAQIITALQTITSRNVPPLESAVVSVCKMEAGTAFNIIPKEAVISGTIRTFKADVYKVVENRFREIVNNLALGMGCEAQINIKRITYPVDNDQALCELMNKVIQQVDPQSKIDSAHQTMGSEDFSYMMQDIPGCFLMVGSANAEKGLIYGHHHPKFDIDETCLPYAVAILAQGAIEILNTVKNPS